MKFSIAKELKDNVKNSLFVLAVKKNLRPAVMLWVLMILFVTMYKQNQTFGDFLSSVADAKTKGGYFFTFVAYSVAAGVFPEVLKRIFRVGNESIGSILKRMIFTGLVFAVAGVITDYFYKWQAIWFGDTANLQTITKKTLVDQFLFCPAINFFIAVAFLWRERRSARGLAAEVLSLDFVGNKLMSILCASWVVWIPGAMLIYFMPRPLQIPTGLLILSFWVMIFSFVEKTNRVAQKTA